MCYPSPGPRCSQHVEAQLKRCKHAFERARKQGNTEDIERTRKHLNNATVEYFTTPKGQKYLKEKIVAGDDTTGKLQKALDRGIAERKATMKAYKASNGTNETESHKAPTKASQASSKPLEFTPAELRESLESINDSGDRLYVPGSLNISSMGSGNLHVRYNSYTNGPCVMQISQKDQSMMAYKDYGDEDEEEVTAARPMLQRSFSQFSRSKDYGNRSADIVANNLVDSMETLDDDKIDWNKDTDAVSFMYFGEAHGDVNSALRNKTYFNKDAIATLDKIMSKDTLSEDIVVYRGIRDYSGKVRKQIEAGTYRDDGYLSTTTNLKTATNFSGGGRGGSIVMSLVLPAGTKCADLRKDSEAEIALPRNFDLSQAKWKFFS